MVEYVFPRNEELTLKGKTMPSTEALETAPEIKLQMLQDNQAVAYGEMILMAGEVDPPICRLL